MAADKKSAPQSIGAKPQRDQAELSDDISRIVGFLDNKRSHANERTQDLVDEIVRGDEAKRRSNGAGQQGLGSQVDETVQTVSDKPQPSVGPRNPHLAVSYHSFCREMDLLLDSFRARVSNTKRVQH